MARLLVPDSCALGAAYFHEASSSNARPLLAAIKSRQFEVAAPAVLLSEFLNICRKKLQGTRTSPAVDLATVEAALVDFLRLPIFYFALDLEFSLQAWRMYRHSQVGTNDAYFLIIASELGGELWTTDAAFCANAAGIHSEVFDLNARLFQ